MKRKHIVLEEEEELYEKMMTGFGEEMRRRGVSDN
jgi:molybdopterin biosynthesis enzyme MoaB